MLTAWVVNVFHALEIHFDTCLTAILTTELWGNTPTICCKHPEVEGPLAFKNGNTNAFPKG